jgi:ABC-type Na+ efflux pump permease subunit
VGGFTRLLQLELTLQRRSFILPATVVSTAVICGFLLLLPGRPPTPRVTAFFVFMDPATIGLCFVGAMVLMEKGQGSLDALAVTPLDPAAYVAAKGVALTLLTFGSGLIVVAVATRGAFDLPRQLLALGLCSAVAVLIGLACVAKAASINHLVMTLLWVSTVLYLPILGHFGVVPGAVEAILAPVPPYAMLAMLTSAVEPDSVSVGV